MSTQNLGFLDLFQKPSRLLAEICSGTSMQRHLLRLTAVTLFFIATGSLTLFCAAFVAKKNWGLWFTLFPSVFDPVVGLVAIGLLFIAAVVGRTLSRP
jgi:hypothetical protein